MELHNSHDNLLEQVGLLIKYVFPNSSLFRLDRKWPDTKGHKFGVEILNSDLVGKPYNISRNDLEHRRNMYQLDTRIHIMCFRESSDELDPLLALTKLQVHLRDDELNYKYFQTENIGLRDFSNVSRADVFLDNETEELRARMTVDFYLTVVEDSLLPSPPVENVRYGISIFENNFEEDNLKVQYSPEDIVTYPEN